MTQKDELLAAYDDVGNHPWESLAMALKPVTEEEAWFQHPAYSDVEQEEGHPPSGTILWHLVHLAHCYIWYKAAIEQRPNKPNEVQPPHASSLAEAIQNLQHHRAALRDTIAAVDEKQLEEPLYYGKPILALVRSTVRHDAWHASQIVMARRLYLMRDK